MFIPIYFPIAGTLTAACSVFDISSDIIQRISRKQANLMRKIRFAMKLCNHPVDAAYQIFTLIASGFQKGTYSFV